MSQENVEIVRQVYEAAARRDAETVLALYDPEVEWDASRGPIGVLVGRRPFRGHEGLRSFFRDWYEAWESIEENCEELIEAGEHVISVVAWRGRGRASGAEAEMQGAGLWAIRDRKVARVVWFETRAEALEAAKTADQQDFL